jgi:O-antigen/teichoic acid export membrane protein
VSIVRTIAKNTIFGFVTSIAEIGVSFVTVTVLTRALGTEQYGLYAYSIWLFTLASLVNNVGLGEMTRRFIPEAIGRQSTDEPVGIVQISLILRIAAALIVCVAILFSTGYWAVLSGNAGNRMVFILAALATFPEATQQALVAIFKGFQKFDYALYVSLAMYPLRLVLLLVFMHLGFGIFTVLLLNIITLSVGVVIGFYLLSRLVPIRKLLSRVRLSSDRRKAALKYSITVAGINMLAYLVSQQAETFFVGLYCSVEDVGFYTLAFKIGSLAALLPSAFAYVLLPAIAEQFGKGEIEKMKKIYLTSIRYLMVITLPLATGGIALASSLITFLYGADYKPSIILFQIICLPIAISSITYAGDTIIRGINRPGFILKTSAIFSVINIGLSLWLIPRYGILGATVANVVTLVLGLPVYGIYINKSIGAIWPFRDMIKIFIASLIMGVAIYTLQKYLHLGSALSLALFIPLGVVLYFAALFVFRVMQEQDLVIFRKIQNSLPVVLRKLYAGLMSIAEMFVGRKHATTGGDSYGNPR